MTPAHEFTWHEEVTPDVKVNNRDLDPTWLDAMVSLTVQVGYRLPGRCVLRFADPKHELVEAAPAFDAEVDVSISGAKVFSGVVTGVSLERPEHATSDLVVVVDDRAHVLAALTKVRTFLNSTTSDIVAVLAAEAGLTSQVDATSTKFDTIVQAGTHLALIDELTAREGLDWWVEGKTLHAARPSVSTRVRVGMEALLALSVRTSGRPRTEVKVNGWDPSTKREITGNAQAPQPPEPAKSKMATRAYHPDRPGKGTALVSAVSPLSADEATTLAKVLSGEASSRGVVVRATTHVDRQIALGAEVELIDAGPANGTYPVTQVEHIWSRSGFRTKFVAGERRPTSLVDTLGAVAPLGGAPIHSVLQHGGLVVGIVTSIKDDGTGGGPAQLGRVKLKLPAISGEMETGWARVAMPGAGNQRGAFFLPEVNDEVLVGFEGGDLRRPVVLGGLYNGKDKPNYVVNGSEITGGRRITSKNKYIVELADGPSPDKQHVLLQLDDVKAKIRLGKDKVEVESPGGKPISLKSGNSLIEIGQDGSITIKGTNVTIESQGELKLSGMNASVAAEAKAEISAKAMLAVKSDGMGEVAASGIMTVKGAMVKIN